MTNPQIDHEVRIRILEDIASKIDKRMDKIESKIDSQFLWIIGLIFVSIIVPVILHSMKLV